MPTSPALRSSKRKVISRSCFVRQNPRRCLSGGTAARPNNVGGKSSILALIFLPTATQLEKADGVLLLADARRFRLPWLTFISTTHSGCRDSPESCMKPEGVFPCPASLCHLLQWEVVEVASTRDHTNTSVCSICTLKRQLSDDLQPFMTVFT